MLSCYLAVLTEHNPWSGTTAVVEFSYLCKSSFLSSSSSWTIIITSNTITGAICLALNTQLGTWHLGSLMSCWCVMCFYNNGMNEPRISVVEQQKRLRNRKKLDQRNCMRNRPRIRIIRWAFKPEI